MKLILIGAVLFIPPPGAGSTSSARHIYALELGFPLAGVSLCGTPQRCVFTGLPALDRLVKRNCRRVNHVWRGRSRG